MLQNAYLVAKIGADTAENEQHLPKFCQKLATTLRAPYVVAPLGRNAVAPLRGHLGRPHQGGAREARLLGLVCRVDDDCCDQALRLRPLYRRPQHLRKL